MEQTDKPVPAFYCCYLLRSTFRHASLYIGSTPNPARRLAQHNGVAKGGANRTAREKLRPWEMTVIVEGFTSRVAALQFEWAWQHPSDSRHVELDEENRGVTINPKTGKTKARSRPSQRSLTAHLSNLHLLLRSEYFSSWPLTVRFFCADVYRVWNLWSQRVDGHLPSHIKVVSDGNCAEGSQCDDLAGSIQQIKTDYSDIEEYLEKAAFLLDDSQDLRCKVCDVHVLPMDELVVVCPQMNCHCIAHMICLSEKFLNAAEPGQFVPTHGICPACNKIAQWPLMMQELTLRRHGEKELRMILRKKKKKDRSNNGSGDQNMTTDFGMDTSGPLTQNVSTEFMAGDHAKGEQDRDEDHRDDSPLDDSWLEALELESESDAGDRVQTHSKIPPRTEIVIEDSDDSL